MRRLSLLFLLVLSLGLAACGGDDGGDSSGSDSGGDGGEDAATLYREAITGLDDLESGKFDAKLDTVLQLGGEQTITVQEKGAFAEGGGTDLPNFDINISVDQSNGQSQSTDAVNTGEEFLVRQNGSDEFQSQGPNAVEQLAKTYEQEQGKLGEGRLPLLSLTPEDWAKNPKNEGEETLDGDKVTKITAELDVPTFLKDLETGKNSEIGLGVTLTQNARQLLEPGAKTSRNELTALVDEDGNLRKLTAGVDGDVAGGVKVDFNVDLSELGEPQEISAPEGT